MTEKNYPTRMHEVLGVEAGDECTFEKGSTKFGFQIDAEGRALITDKSEGDYLCGYYLTLLINHPERIIRRPRLTEEQVRKLKALYDFGMRWMFFTYSTAHNPCLYATTNKPFYTEPDWDGQGGWSWNGERLRIKGSPLNDLERVLADAQLDIVQTLRDAGVEVDDA